MGLGAVQQWATVALEYPALDLAHSRDDRAIYKAGQQACITRGAPASPDHASAPCKPIVDVNCGLHKPWAACPPSLAFDCPLPCLPGRPQQWELSAASSEAG